MSFIHFWGMQKRVKTEKILKINLKRKELVLLTLDKRCLTSKSFNFEDYARVSSLWIRIFVLWTAECCLALSTSGRLNNKIFCCFQTSKSVENVRLYLAASE